MEPVTAVTTAWTIAKTAGEVSKKLYEFGKNLKDREAKQQVEEIIDKLHELKQKATELEDENRDLKEKLRFKTEDFEFKNPFWFDKQHPERPLCPKCFSKGVIAPVAMPYDNDVGVWRKCLSCDSTIEETPRNRATRSFTYGNGPDGWMG